MPEESKLTEKLEEKKSEVKWTEEELKQVQNIQKSYANVQNQFGQLKLAQIRLDKDEIQLEDALKSRRKGYKFKSRSKTQNL